MSNEARFLLEVGAFPPTPDLVLAGFKSLREFQERVRALRDAAPPGYILTAVMEPSKARDISIPRAFGVLVALLDESHVKAVVHVRSEEILDHLYRYLPSAAEEAVRFPLGRCDLEFVVADIVRVRADAIVNASNPTLKLGGGVSGAIRDAADPSLQAELNRLTARGPLADGAVAITEGFGLPCARRIIHAVVVKGTTEVVTTAVCNTLCLCDREGLASVALPALGAGTGGLPLEGFVDALRAGCLEHQDRNAQGSLRQVIVCLWTRTDRRHVLDRWSATSQADDPGRR